MRKILLLSVRVCEIGVGVVAGTYFFWRKCSWSLMYIKVSLAILLEKGGNLALLLDTRKWMLDALSNLLDSEKQMLENARNRAEI